MCTQDMVTVCMILYRYAYIEFKYIAHNTGKIPKSCMIICTSANPWLFILVVCDIQTFHINMKFSIMIHDVLYHILHITKFHTFICNKYTKVFLSKHMATNYYMDPDKRPYL